MIHRQLYIEVDEIDKIMIGVTDTLQALGKALQRMAKYCNKLVADWIR